MSLGFVRGSQEQRNAASSSRRAPTHPLPHALPASPPASTGWLPRCALPARRTSRRLLLAFTCLAIAGGTALAVYFALKDEGSARSVTCVLDSALEEDTVRLQEDCVLMNASKTSTAGATRRRLFAADVYRTFSEEIVPQTLWDGPPSAFWVNMDGKIPANQMGDGWKETILPYCAPTGWNNASCPLFYEILDEDGETVIDIRNATNASLQDVIIHKVYNYDDNWEHHDDCANAIAGYDRNNEEHRYRCNTELYNDGGRYIDARQVELVDAGGVRVVAIRSNTTRDVQDGTSCPAGAVRVLEQEHYSVIYTQLLLHLYLRYETGLTSAANAPRVQLNYKAKPQSTLKVDTVTSPCTPKSSISVITRETPDSSVSL